MHRSTSTLVVATLLLVSMTAAPAVASHDASSAADGVLGDDSSIVGWATGLANRLGGLFGGVDTDATTACSDLQTTFNEHNTTIQDYVNNRTDASSDANVLAVTCAIDDESTTRYLVADVDGDNYTNATMVDSTDRTVDETCTLEGSAAANASDELQTFVDKFASTGDDVTGQFRSRLRAQYAGKVDCTFL